MHSVSIRSILSLFSKASVSQLLLLLCCHGALTLNELFKCSCHILVIKFLN